MTTAGSLLSFDQVADRLGVSTKTVRRIVERGELRTVDIYAAGRRPIRRISESEYRAYTSAREGRRR